jgi:orotidine-5'-phosphate decarboxylase
LKPFARWFKVGSCLFPAEGPDVVRQLSRQGCRVFLDLKFHDIPNTVSAALQTAARLPGVGMLTIHASGGLRMMEAAVSALRKGIGRKRPKLLGVTVLTSLDRGQLAAMKMPGSPAARVLRLARLARRAGLDGVVASAEEVAAIRRACGANFLIVVPGVRPAAAKAAKPAARPAQRDDQARVATPAEAIRWGADYLVVGRPILQAADPAAAAAEIAAEIRGASRASRRI